MASRQAVRGGNAAVADGESAALEIDAEMAMDGDKYATLSLLDGEGSSKDDGLTAMAINLVKTIVGAGVLSLPASVTTFGDGPSALFPATLLCIAMGSLSAYCFSLIGRVCNKTGALTFRGAWVISIGEASSWIPAAAITGQTVAFTVAFSMILADTSKDLLITATGIELGRASALVLLTSTVLLPLCMLKDLAALAPFSLLGILGIGFTVCAMLFRFGDGSYALATGDAPDGQFLADVASAVAPMTPAREGQAAATAAFICKLSSAYVAHYSAPKFFSDLQTSTPSRLSQLARFNKLVAISYAVSVAFCLAVMCVGFFTFGSSCTGLILNNYSGKDSLMNLCTLCISMSLVFTYPLVFMAAREGVFDSMGVAVKERTAAATNKLTVFLLVVITVTALALTDLSLLLSLSGAVLGNGIIFVFPSMMFRGAFKNVEERRRERVLCGGVAIFGLVVGGIGVALNLKKH
jgi:amino acid permease